MTDQLITTLSQLEGMNVISRTSVMRFKGSQLALADIARTLNVDAVLEGSVQVLPGSEEGTSERIRITARLIQADTDTSLWNRTFERSGSDVFALQSEIARSVSEGIDLRRTLLAGPVTGRAQDFDVFDLYLRGRYYWNMRTEEGFRRSIQYFQESINRDPRFALAHAGLADAYNLLGVYAFTRRDEALPRARTAALTALGLDDSLGEAHASLGHIEANRLEWDAAEASFQRALDLNPGYASAHHWYADYLAQRQRFPEAIQHIETAKALDPLSVSVTGEAGAILVFARRYQDAIAPLRAALRLDPRFPKVHMMLAQAFTGLGRFDEATVEAERAVSMEPGNPEFRANLGWVLAVAGRRNEAAPLLPELTAQYRNGEHAEPLAIALLEASLGNNDQSFEWLERARQIRDPWLGYLKVDPRFDNLRVDPRFDRLLQSVGLAP
jgi:tetratricopeptide (TPR) repeat protein